MEEPRCVLVNIRSTIKQEFIPEDLSKEGVILRESKCKERLVKSDTFGVISAESISEDLDIYSVIKEELVIENEDIQEESDTFGLIRGKSISEDLDIYSIIKEELVIENEDIQEELTSSSRCILKNEDIIQQDSQYGTSGSKHQNTGLFEDKSGLWKYQCEVCNKVLISSTNLSRHKLIHSETNNSRPTCAICGKSFSHGSGLSHHKKIHSGIENYQCVDIRKYQCVGIRKYQCDICNKAFIRKAHMVGHILIHSGIKKYKCDICGKAFMRKYDMSKHKLIHIRTEKYKCDICDKAFSKGLSLSEHRYMIHTHSSKEISV